MPEPTTLDIPRWIVLEHVNTARQDPDTEHAQNAAYDTLAAIQAAGPDTYRLTVEAACRLHTTSNALSVYDLDECADATYRHPAVIAETEVLQAAVDQAPEVDARLEAERAALIDSLA